MNRAVYQLLRSHGFNRRTSLLAASIKFEELMRLLTYLGYGRRSTEEIDDE